MAMTLEQFANKYPSRPRPIPVQYAGQWIAWDANRQQVVAHGWEFSKVRTAAIAAGHTEPILQKVPRGLFIGGI
jgi:hypothetical protein